MDQVGGFPSPSQATAPARSFSPSRKLLFFLTGLVKSPACSDKLRSPFTLRIAHEPLKRPKIVLAWRAVSAVRSCKHVVIGSSARQWLSFGIEQRMMHYR